MSNRTVNGFLKRSGFFGLLVVLFFGNIVVHGDVKSKRSVQESTSVEKGDRSVILLEEILVGGFGNGKWRDASQTFNNVKNEERFKVYSMGKLLGETIGKKPTSIDKDDFNQFDLSQYKGEYAAVNCNWNPMPRSPKLQDPSNPSYQKAVGDILKENGVKKALPIQIQQLIRIDIDGDGTEEVLIMAENVSPLSGMYSKNNQYSMLFMRKAINGKVNNIFIEKDITVTDREYAGKNPFIYSIVGILDVNNDGVMELLVKEAYYEGISYLIYELKKDKVQMVLSVGFGA